MKNSIVNNIFRENLVALRGLRKYSQDELAALASLDRSYISLIERGEKSPTLRTIINIADALNVEVFELFIKRK